jgi:hypothetical protein
VAAGLAQVLVTFAVVRVILPVVFGNPGMLHVTVSVGCVSVMHFVGVNGALLKRLSKASAETSLLRSARKAKLGMPLKYMMGVCLQVTVSVEGVGER